MNISRKKLVAGFQEGGDGGKWIENAPKVSEMKESRAKRSQDGEVTIDEEEKCHTTAAGSGESGLTFLYERMHPLSSKHRTDRAMAPSIWDWVCTEDS